MDEDKFMEMAEPYLEKYLKPGLDRKKIGAMVKTRIEVFPDIEGLVDFFNALLYTLLQNYAAEHEYKNGYVLWPVRTAVSGKQMTPAGATEIMEIIGKEESIARIKKGIELLEA